ncbi:hypothetical protein DSO57_1037047 [Entomophthora muscae]|uniref:Uncharacterized protein n=1 Tax=Entomophthora muscae TaxID=34485 RepID=A0ACC2UIY8_9FUNG|nr:hypothetical protein DSO57_1037047 [Entomophthora muscae]
MPLYELCLIIRGDITINNIKDLIKKTSQTVWTHNGVVRGFQHSGVRNLPQPMKRHQTNFLQGTYVQMQFDANPHTLQDLRSTLKVDPRVIRVRCY